MAVPVPYELTHLLDHLEPSARDEAWTAFVQANSKLILYVARSLGGDHDDVTDLGTGEANDINNRTASYGQEVVGFRRGSKGDQATGWRVP